MDAVSGRAIHLPHAHRDLHGLRAVDDGCRTEEAGTLAGCVRVARHHAAALERLDSGTQRIVCADILEAGTVDHENGNPECIGHQ